MEEEVAKDNASRRSPTPRRLQALFFLKEGRKEGRKEGEEASRVLDPLLRVAFLSFSSRCPVNVAE
jgi:hypothetical protein